MTKGIIFICFFLTINILQAQTSDSDNSKSSLQKTSEDLLSRKFNFFQEKGKLEKVLLQLSSEQQIKFSYSSDKIQHVEVNDKLYSNTDLSTLLSNLLLNTGLNFLVVGRIIVIVEDDKNKNIPNAIKDKPASVDSVLVNNIVPLPLQDTTVSQLKNTPTDHPGSSGPENPNLQKNTKLSGHIYSEDINLLKLPKAERKKIQKIYSRELQWAHHYKRKGSNLYHFHSVDSLEENKSNVIQGEVNPLFRYYVSGNLGLVNYVPKIKGTSDLEWKQDLQYNSNISHSIRPEIAIGFITKKFISGIGIGFQKLKTHEFGTGIYKKSNGIGQGQGNQPDTFTYNYVNRYSLISIPLELLLYKQWKDLFAGIGTKIELDLIHSNVVEDRFKTYYIAKAKSEDYISKNHKATFSAGVKASAGYMLNENMALAASGQYNYYFSYLSKTSVFSFYPNSLQFQISLVYFMNKSEVRRIFGKY